MKWLRDTDVVSENVKRRPKRGVIDWIARCPPSLVAISIVTLAELRVGAETTANRDRRAELMSWIEEEIENLFRNRTLPLTTEILIEWIQLARRNAAAGMTRAPADLLIGATARVHDLVIVSRNARDFAGMGVFVYDPWMTERTEWSWRDASASPLPFADGKLQDYE
jgi:predicted nucleic acid-binding protein